MVKWSVLTDSANASSSLAPGSPHPTEETANVLSSYLRNWVKLLVLCFGDNDYNLADCGSKNDTVSNRLLRVAHQTNVFEIGSMGRRWMQAQRENRMKK